MCKLFSEWEQDIRRYCERNALDFARVQESGKCWGKDFLMLQHIDPASGTQGLRDETPAPVVLMVRREPEGLVFEQTRYTRKYLAQ